ncbi:NupC/NupG family nucleoside CNT transporter [Rouxiella sp. S1S-2]|uniref:NupC/NupG family nucleoside CNT transporter n=1 Tax=Rouxiella sp. S1S-2 TaxID=2653856 RepID=UPI0012649CD7|nr:NupC/NupG family nucleoside CNT transporter [Rouxiella sp. S1S-2]KAB7898942.1 NupC/NupG family nucleoside CNT transporter [Rouxiella sp. S1S-2]
MDIMRSVLGMGVLLAIAFIISVNKKNISLRTVGAALILQITIGGAILYLPPGKWLAEKVAFGIHNILNYSDAGSSFIFGALAGPDMNRVFNGAGFVFAFHVLPAIIFMTSLVSLLYYIGIMKVLINILGGIFQKALKISKIESFVAVTTIFLGQNEIPAIVKPFINRLNRNELFTAICSGMASIAGSTMIGYAGLGVPIDYLLAASLMAIPGGILFARILSPATEESQIVFDNLSFSETPPKSIIEAVASGAMTGLKIAVGVGTVVMAFVAIIALINGIIGGVAGLFGFAHASLEGILGLALAPLAWLMGVDWNDATLAGSLIGQKLAINEFVAYLSFSPYLQTAGTLDVKTIAIISFALCGFANFGSIGVVVGAFSAIAPQRTSEIAQLGLRALAAATLSNLMSATIAGFFIGIT